MLPNQLEKVAQIAANGVCGRVLDYKILRGSMPPDLRKPGGDFRLQISDFRMQVLEFILV